MIFRKDSNYILAWIGLSLIVILSFIFFTCFYKYNRYYFTQGIIVKEGDKSYVQVIVENDKLDFIKNGNLIIDKNVVDFNYEIDPGIYNVGNKIYYRVNLKINFNYENNEIISIGFKNKGATTIFNEIRKGMK